MKSMGEFKKRLNRYKPIVALVFTVIIIFIVCLLSNLINERVSLLGMQKDIAYQAESWDPSYGGQRLMLTKKDGITEEVMPNVKFAISEIVEVDEEEAEERIAYDKYYYAVGTFETINGVEYQIVETDSDGRITTSQLRVGKYKLVEVETLLGYYLPEEIEERTYYFEIEEIFKEEKELSKVWDSIGDYNYRHYYADIVVTPDGGCVVAGSFNYYITIPAGETVGNQPIALGDNNYISGLIVKYNSVGKIEYAKSVEGVYHDGEAVLYGITTTPDGGYVVTGYFWGDIIIPAQDTVAGVQILVSTYNLSGLIIKYNSQGLVEYVRQVEGLYDSVYFNEITVTADGGFAVIGRAYGDIIIPAQDTALGVQIVLNNATYADGIVIKYNSQGLVEYVKNIGGTSSVDLYEVAATEDGGIVVVGRFWGILTTGIPGTLTGDGWLRQCVYCKI